MPISRIDRCEIGGNQFWSLTLGLDMKVLCADPVLADLLGRLYADRDSSGCEERIKYLENRLLTAQRLIADIRRTRQEQRRGEKERVAEAMLGAVTDEQQEVIDFIRDGLGVEIALPEPGSSNSGDKVA